MALLPQELVDQIIDFLHDDHPTLQSCTLVARAWLPSSRLHLFTNITIGVNSPRFYEFLAEFLAYTRSSCAFGPQYVREMTLTGLGAGYSTATRNPVTQAILVDLLACLPLLEYLNLIFVTLDHGQGAEPLSSAPGAVRSSGTLKLDLKAVGVVYCDAAPDKPFSGLAACLDAFTHIGKLHLIHSRVPDNVGVAHFGDLLGRALPPVDALVIRDQASSLNTYLRALDVAPAAQCLRSLNIESESWPGWDHAQLGASLERVGSGIRCLGIDLSAFSEPEGNSDIPTLNKHALMRT